MPPNQSALGYVPNPGWVEKGLTQETGHISTQSLSDLGQVALSQTHVGARKGLKCSCSSSRSSTARFICCSRLKAPPFNGKCLLAHTYVCKVAAGPSRSHASPRIPLQCPRGLQRLRPCTCIFLSELTGIQMQTHPPGLGCGALFPPRRTLPRLT